MKLNNHATVRTGLVLSRKESLPDESQHIYRVISLKNVTQDNRILVDEVEVFFASEQVKNDYLTRDNDILLRLSVPYSVILITEREKGLLVPAHFAIIRTNATIVPSYLHWWLIKKRKHFYQLASGATMMGTISSGYVAEMFFEPPPLEFQQKFAELLELSNREQELINLLGMKKKQLIDAVLKKYQ